jgi:hypothetical protein
MKDAVFAVYTKKESLPRAVATLTAIVDVDVEKLEITIDAPTADTVARRAEAMDLFLNDYFLPTTEGEFGLGPNPTKIRARLPGTPHVPVRLMAFARITGRVDVTWERLTDERVGLGQEHVLMFRSAALVAAALLEARRELPTH